MHFYHVICFIYIILISSTPAFYLNSFSNIRNQRLAKLFPFGILFLFVLFNIVSTWLTHKLLFRSNNPFLTIHNFYNHTLPYTLFTNVTIWLISTLFASLILCIIFILVLYLMHLETFNQNLFLARLYVLVVCNIILICSFIIYGESIEGNKKLRFSELYVWHTLLNDEMSSPYIKLQNIGRYPIDIDNYFLSDDDEDLLKLHINSGMISPGEEKTIFLDSLPFSISKSGGDTIYLSDENLNILDYIQTPPYLYQHAYGRNSDVENWHYVAPTPNDTSLIVETPSFSAESGFYDCEFDLELCTSNDATIYYTVDGSTPDTTSIPYTNPIHVYDKSNEPNVYRSIPNLTYDWYFVPINTDPVPKAFVVRAIAINNAGISSDVVTKTYLINQQQYETTTLVSLVSDPEDLFGPDGIYSTGKTYDEWYQNGGEGNQPAANFEIHGLECPTNLQIFEQSNFVLEQPAGVRIQGGSHRDGRIKRLSVFARNKYNKSDMFEYNLFDNKQTHSFALRPGFDNAFIMDIASNRNVSIQRSIPATVFLNGEYWYDTYIQEKYNTRFFQQTYHVSNVEFHKSGMSNDIASFLNTHDLSNASEYDEFNKLIDIQSFIDYTCINVYVANTDYSEYGNVAIWRTRDYENSVYGDGRWRWCLYDLDLVTNLCREELNLLDVSNAELDTFHVNRSWGQPVAERPIFSNLMKNEFFRKQFVLTFMDLVNTIFSQPSISEKLNEWGEDISYKNYFYQQRAEYITQHMANLFELTGSKESLSLTTNNTMAGDITVNTCVANFKDNLWSGYYYTDYPVTLVATPKKGYRFVQWEGDITSSSNDIEVAIPNGGINIHAIFEKE